MKKKVIFAALVAVATLSGYMGYSSQERLKVNTLVMANVEVLSKSNEQGLTILCCSYPKYTGSWDDMTSFCSGCTYRIGYTGSNDSRCPK